MNGSPAEQVLKELLPYLEAPGTQSVAILQFLKDKGLTTDEQLAPYLERAGNASSVKWRAARVRMEHLFSSTEKGSEKARDKNTEQSTDKPEKNSAAPDKHEGANETAKHAATKKDDDTSAKDRAKKNAR